MIVVCGAGPHGREIADVARDSYLDVVFLDDNTDLPEVEGPLDALALYNAGYVYGAAWPAIRHLIHTRARAAGVRWEAATLIHMEATVSRTATLEPGVVIAAGVRITNGTLIGAHTHIKVNATVSHSCQVGSFCTIAPGANIAGEVMVGDDVFIGVGAAIKHGVKIGSGALVGAGAVVIGDVEPGATVVGVPARPLRGAA